jgi:hypothetical protein
MADKKWAVIDGAGAPLADLFMQLKQYISCGLIIVSGDATFHRE